MLEADIVTYARKWGEEASERLEATSVEIGRWDLILHPSQLFLTFHETIGHATELDRAMGYEANLAGTSFISPPEKVLGSLRLGPGFVQVIGSRSEPGARSTIGYDDDGVQPQDFHIVKDGIFVDYQTTREQPPWLEWWYTRSATVRGSSPLIARPTPTTPSPRAPTTALARGGQVPPPATGRRSTSAT